jgi:RNA polymerase sigma factor (sigma-70 family)
MMADDMELVREFATRRSDAAFETLVSRHLNLVYSVALRQVRDPHLAQEVAQAVFIILARKAGSLGQNTILSGWLFRTAQYASADALKSQRRRQHREQEAYMQSILNCGCDAPSQPTNEEAWTQIAPLLDAAMLRLGEKDRNAIVLRYFENKNLREVGAALGASEDSARVRINRALEKLRTFFTKRGVMLSATVIATAVSANSVQAAPVGLAATISAAAVKSSAVAASTLTLVKGALKIMAWTKAKMVIVTSAVVLLAAGTTTVAVKVIHERPMVVQGKTESEWIKSIVYFGDDKQRELWHLLGPKGIQMLVRALQPPPKGLAEEQANTHRVNRMKAASVLCQLADYKLGNDVKSAIPEIINLLKTEKDDSVRGIELSIFEMPIQTMDGKEKAALFPELLRAMQSEDSSVRNNSLVALQYYPNQSDIVIPLMVKALQDPIPGVRVMAIKALNKVDPQNAASSSFVAILAGCVTGTPGDMPGAANDAVIMLGDLHREPEVAVPVLIQCLQSPDTYVRHNAASALGKFGSQAKSAVPALTKALEDSDAGVRRMAAGALKHINSGAAANQ